MERLREAIVRAAHGTGRLVVVEGPAGVGKTRLLEEAAAIAADAGATVLGAQGAELERSVPFGVARELLAPCAVPERFTGLAALAAPLFERAGAGPGLVQGLHALLVDVCAGAPAAAPPLLRVDDAQWCDRSSLRFLAYVAARLEHLPVILAVAVRRGDPGAHHDLIDALHAIPAAVVLRPQPLSGDAVSRFVAAAVGDDAATGLSEACARVTGGNPFYLRELVTALDQARGDAPTAADVETVVPGSLLHSTLLRLGALGTTAAKLAAAVAVLDDGASLAVAAALAGLSDEDAEAAADALAGADFLAPGEPLRLTHPLIASALRADMGAFARSRAHRRAADILAAAGAPVERVAAHFLLTRPNGDAAVIGPLRAAAELAGDRGEPPAAVRLLARALAEPPPPDLRADVLVELAHAEARSGSRACLAHTEAALEVIEDPRRRAETLGSLARLLHHAGDFAGAASTADRARAQLDPGDALQPGLLATFIGAAVLEPALLGRAEAELRPLIEAARAGRETIDPRLLAQIVIAMVRSGDPPELVRKLAEAALASDPLVDGDPQGASLGFVAAALVWVDELEAAEQALEAAVAAARARGAMTALSIALHNRAIVHYHRGRLAEAVADAEHSLEIYRDGWTGSPWSTPILAHARAARGQLDAAAQAIAVGERAAEGRAEDALLLEAKAAVALAQGDGDAALAAARLAGEVAEGQFGTRNARIFDWRRLAALGALRTGRDALAAELIEEQLAMVRACGAPRQLGATLHAAGLIAGGDAGIALLEEGVAVLERSPARLKRAQALLGLGSLLRRAGRRGDAREPLFRAFELGGAFGAEPLTAAARAELHAVGLRPRQATRSGRDALTPSERRVADLAASGLSSPEIARELYVTRKTVESHLAKAYRKLGIARRAELRAALSADQAR